MDQESKALFEEIVAKDQESLTRPEAEFLMARRSYMNDADKKRYADMIKKHEAGTLFPAEEGADEDLSKLSLKQLKKIAKEKGVEGLSKMKTPEEVIEAINEVEGADDEDEG